MITDLPTINQQGIKSLLRERIEHPNLHADKPLIIWRSDIRDGIQERLLSEVFLEKYPYEFLRMWYKIASIRKMPLRQESALRDMLTAEYVDRNDNVPYDGGYHHDNSKEPEMCHIGLYVIDPVCAAGDYRRKPETLANYQSVINSRNWNDIQLPEGVPTVAYMCIGEPWFETPEAYPNAEQYLFEPDFEEWAQWVENEDKLPREVIDFIREDITYRWYNHFNMSGDGQEPKGCEYPGSWLKARINWPNLVAFTREYGEQTPQLAEDLHKRFRGRISQDVLTDLIKYLTQH